MPSNDPFEWLDPTPATPELDENDPFTWVDQPPAREDSSMPKWAWDYVSGFNDRFANVLALPADATAAVINELGSALGQNPELNPSQWLKDRMNSIGMSTQAVDTLAGRIGGNTLDALLTLSAFSALAPSAGRAASTFAGTTSTGEAIVPTMGLRGQAMRAMEELGRTAAMNPATAIGSEVGAAAGEEFGNALSQDWPDTVAPLGSALGAAAGGIVGAGVAEGVARTGRWAATKVLGTGKKAAGLARDAAGKPILEMDNRPPLRTTEEGVNAFATKPFAESEVARDKALIEKAYTRAARPLQTGKASADLQVKARQSIKAAADATQRIEDRYWAAIPDTVEVHTSGVSQVASQMLKDAPNAPSDYPTEILKLFTPGKGTIRVEGKKWTRFKPAETFARIKAVRQVIRRARVSEAAKIREGREPNNALIRNLNQLDDAIMDSLKDDMDAAGLGDVFADARGISTVEKDIFNRSTLGRIMSRNRLGGETVLPEETGEAVLKQAHGVKDIVSAKQQMDAFLDPRADKTPAEFERMIAAHEDAIRQIMHDVVQEDPRKGMLWLKRQEGRIRPMAKLAADVETIGRRIAEVSRMEAKYNKSLLHKFVDGDPEVAIRRLFTAPDKEKQAAALVARFRKDPDALKALRTGVLDEFIVATGAKPTAMFNRLQRPDVARMLQTVLSSGDYQRLSKMVRIAHQIDTGSAPNVAKQVATPVLLLGRVVGAQVGRVVARHTGGGSVQTPAIFSRAMADTLNSAMTGTKGQVLLRKAILDPKWERVLYMRDPITTTDVRAMKKTLRKALTGIEAFRYNVAKEEEEEE